MGELKRRTEINQLEDLIHHELENSGQREVEGHVQATPVHVWQADFPNFDLSKDYVGTVDKRAAMDTERFGGTTDRFEAVVPSDTSLVEKKFLSLEQFFDFLKNKFYNKVTSIFPLTFFP